MFSVLSLHIDKMVFNNLYPKNLIYKPNQFIATSHMAHATKSWSLDDLCDYYNKFSLLNKLQEVVVDLYEFLGLSIAAVTLREEFTHQDTSASKIVDKELKKSDLSNPMNEFEFILKSNQRVKLYIIPNTSERYRVFYKVSSAYGGPLDFNTKVFLYNVIRTWSLDIDPSYENKRKFIEQNPEIIDELYSFAQSNMNE